MKHSHMLICALLVVVGVILVAVGASGLVFLPALACMLMMGLMVWMMVRPGGHGGGT